MNLSPLLQEREEILHTPALTLIKALKGRSDSLMRNLKLREVKQLAQHHTATKWQSQAQSPHLADRDAHALPTSPQAAVVVPPESLLAQQRGPDPS